MAGQIFQRGAQTGLRLFVAQQLVGQDAALLVLQLRAAGFVARPGELEIDELHAQLEVAAFAMPATRVGQRTRQRFGVDPRAVAGFEPLQRTQSMSVGGVDL